jgi:uncharacterized integral membrane protein
MNEWLMILCVTVSAALFASGGTDIPGIGGQKWLRRYVLPAFLAFICVLSGVKWWVSLGYGLLMIPLLCAGYGDRAGYFKRVLIFVSYGLPSLLIGFSVWIIITPVLLTLLFIGSNTKQVASQFVWKMWELMAGVLIGMCLIAALVNRW